MVYHFMGLKRFLNDFVPQPSIISPQNRRDFALSILHAIFVGITPRPWDIVHT